VFFKDVNTINSAESDNSAVVLQKWLKRVLIAKPEDHRVDWFTADPLSLSLIDERHAAAAFIHALYDVFPNKDGVLLL